MVDNLKLVEAIEKMVCRLIVSISQSQVCEWLVVTLSAINLNSISGHFKVTPRRERTCRHFCFLYVRVVIYGFPSKIVQFVTPLYLLQY